MRHDPSNPNCDKTAYGPDAQDVKCTCDVDTPDDVPRPSTVIPAGLLAQIASPGGDHVTLTGRKAQVYRELEEATRELDAARKLMAPAQERFTRAMNAMGEEMCR